MFYCMEDKACKDKFSCLHCPRKYTQSSPKLIILNCYFLPAGDEYRI